MALYELASDDDDRLIGDLEARIERLREALRIAAIIMVMDHELKTYSPYYPSPLGDEEARSELGLLRGDLPEYD